jgi:hypothetical protein
MSIRGAGIVTNVQKGIVSIGMSGRSSVDFDTIPEHAFLLCAPGRRVHSSADISKDGRMCQSGVGSAVGVVR